MIGVVLSSALIGGSASPVWAAPAAQSDSSEVELGSFALGDGLEGSIGEFDGSFGFALSAGGVHLAWDSRAAGVDAVGLGGGWSFGLTTLRVTGGVWVFPASGGAYPMDATAPTGLAGYPRADVRFEAAPAGATVPARADGVVGATPYAYVLHELGGVSTYFDEHGRPVARLVVGGDRMDWRWEAGAGTKLLAIVTSDGSVTALDWSDPARLTIHPGSAVTEPGEGTGVGASWHVELDGGRVAAVTDPIGGRTRVAYDQAGLVHRVSAPSGAATVVRWRTGSDAVARVESVRVVDEATGAELSVREWGAAGEAAPSGWPFVDHAALGAVAGPGGETMPYETWVSDGKTRVTSAVDARGRVAGRGLVVTSSAGERLVQGQEFAYPDASAAVGAASPPIAATTTHHDAQGGSRSVSESYVHDEFGRMVSRTAADGSVTRRVYDDVVQPGRPLPVGIVVEETTTATDGSVTSTRSALTEDRAAVAAVERWMGLDGAEAVRTERVESDVDDGFVSEQRVFPGGDPAAVPVVTRWSREIDLRRGTRTVVQTEAAGTPVETSARSVSSIVHGGVLSETDPIGNVSSARYDEAGRRIAVEDASGRAVRHEYRTHQLDGVNEVIVTDVSTGVSATEQHDVLGRLTRKTDNIDPSGRAVDGFERVVETREYDAPGEVRVTDAWGAVTTTSQDVFGRTERVTLPNGLVQVAAFDDVAGTATSGLSLTGTLDDAEATTTQVLDTSGRVTETTGHRADGVEVPASTTAYDGFGREVGSTDGTLNTAIDYDPAGNAIASSVGPLTADAGAGVTAEREYDGFGVSVEKTLRSGSESYAGQRRELDELGRVRSQTDQRGSTEVRSYTPDGLVAEVVSDTGRVASYEYDPTSRALVGTRVGSPHGATVASTLRYDEAGRLTAVFDPADETGTLIGYEHDAFGNVTSTRYPDGAEIRHEYDAHGRKTATIDVDGNRTEYAYDAVDGSMLAAVQVDRDGEPLSEVRYRYDEYGRANVLERGNGVRTEYTFTSAGEVASEITTGPDGLRSEREYVYSPAGNLTSRVDRVCDDTGEIEVTRTDYEYDAFDRLIRSELRDGASPASRVATRTVYEPTIGGDLAAETVTTDPETAEEVSTTRRFEYSETGELVAIATDGDRRSQVFDADGNLLAAATGARYQYDAAGRPVAHTTADGVEIATSYWPDGSRRKHTTPSGATRYYWDGDSLLNEVHQTADGAQGTASYLYGVTRQARSIRPDGGVASVSYYGTDRHGNVTELTDQAGTVTTSYRYSDYGVVTATGDHPKALPGGIGELGYNPFQYAGEYTYRDGMQPLGIRTYDPAQARFLTEDDAPLANLYAFGDLNPITNIDPTGRDAEKDWLHTVAGVVGFMMAFVGGLALISTPGPGYMVFGMIGLGLGIGDAMLAGIQAIEASLSVTIARDEAIEIASWVFFAGSVIVGFSGAAVKWAANRGSKAAARCFELMNCAGGSAGDDIERMLKKNPSSALDAEAAHRRIMRWHGWLQDADLDGLETAVGQVADTKVKRNVSTALTHLRKAKSVAAAEAGVARDFSYHALEKTHRKLAPAYQSLVIDLHAARRQLSSAQTRLTSAAGSGFHDTQSARAALARVRDLGDGLDDTLQLTPPRSPRSSLDSPRGYASDPPSTEQSPLLLRVEPLVSDF